MLKTIRVSIVDDQPLFRDGVIHTLKTQLDMEVVGQGASKRDAMRIAQESTPDVIIIGMSLPDDGLETFDAIMTSYPLAKVLLLSDMSDEDRICEAITRGLHGYLPKSTGGAGLVDAVRALDQGIGCISPTLAPKLLMYKQTAPNTSKPRDRLKTLTPRERQILSMLTGLSNRQIGDKLELSEGTVKYYVTSIMNKIQVRNRVEAALFARSQGVTHQGCDEEYTISVDFGNLDTNVVEYRSDNRLS
ncbi:response regulator transcription factor [Microvirga sp. VF16]|uniref:LuxR C-terminal-related transcriptional regulator n=1 Tax=Microvirga sp. VF16 TaxID=2807101 RepID=UPI00193D9A2A|nr:response regulator transcription factor [Microvirga sp. VF16]QRM31581.1 response regulator transcription factor [Microvirga sp. VF16]